MKKQIISNGSIERKRPTFLKIGLIASLAFALMAFEYTTWSSSRAYFDDDIEIYMLEEEIIHVKLLKDKVEPETADEPDPGLKKEVDPNKFKIDNEFEKGKDEKKPKEFTPPTKETSDGLVTVVDPMEEVDEIVDFLPAGDLPYYDFCGLDTPVNKRKYCTEMAFMTFIQDHLRIPEYFVGEQKAFVYFVVDKKGKITDIELLNDVPPWLEKEIIRLFNQMPDLIPGHQRSIPVGVKYRMPVSVIRR